MVEIIDTEMPPANVQHTNDTSTPPEVSSDDHRATPQKNKNKKTSEDSKEEELKGTKEWSSQI